MARATVLEALIGDWQADKVHGAQVMLRDNLTYRVLQRNESGPATTLVEGAYRWNQQANELHFRDGILAPCGGAQNVGRYAVDAVAGERLRMQCIDDPCELRRRALTEWGPYHASQPDAALTGYFMSWTDQRFMLHFSPAGVFHLWDLDRELLPPAEGSYEVYGSTVRLVDQAGHIFCRPEPADYHFEVQGEALTLVAINDPCVSRSVFYAAHPVWVAHR